MFIYILKLEEGKYYVGRTNRLVDRIEAHVMGRGSEWTKKYKVKKLIRSYETNDMYDEEKETRRCMSRYGIRNVRGGSYARIEIGEVEIKRLRREIRGSEGRCYYCGKKGHYWNGCYRRYLFSD
jgi:hypothetical protein